MLNVAIVGSGPAGCYAAEALARHLDGAVAIDLIDRLPTPFGLIRAGVAPDHQSIKAVARRFEATAALPNVRLAGGVTIGRDVSVEELRLLYDAVVLATGAPADRRLGIPGEDLPGVIGSAAFVGWYNGHPDHAALGPPLAGPSAMVIGAGNVALDVARILAKRASEFDGSDLPFEVERALGASGIVEIAIVARRGAGDARFSAKELAEVGELGQARAIVDAADLPPAGAAEFPDRERRKLDAILRGYASPEAGDTRPIALTFRFNARPVAFAGDGAVKALTVQTARGVRSIPCQLAVTCIGYRSEPLGDLPFDHASGAFTNQAGRIAPGVYCVGWARRGPTGTIGTNRPDAEEVAARICAEVAPVARPGARGLDDILAGRGVAPVTLASWRRIDAIEVSGARDGRPREKLVTHAELAAASRLPEAASAAMSPGSVGE